MQLTPQWTSSSRVSDRDEIILGSYDKLRADLESLLPDRKTPVALIKVSVCKLLEPKLVADGFNIINRGRRIPFPANGHQRKFSDQFGSVMRAAVELSPSMVMSEAS
jgi:hypothetical protein